MAETDRTANHMTERGWVGLLDDECLRAHVELDRLRLHPERPDRDANLLDNVEDGLARAVEAQDEAVARREQLRTGLHEAERLHQLGLPPLANPSDAAGGESS
jgi:hypothetical protein